jgi:glycosyltransferase involved in cell wall biosynthesis
MRILFLNPTGQIGGAERVLLDLMASLRQAEPDWRLQLVVGAHGPLVDACRTSGIPTDVIPFSAALARLGDGAVGGPAGRNVSAPVLLARLLRSSAGIAQYLRLLGRRLAELNPDVIHTNGFKMHGIGAWAKPRMTPLVWHIHDYVTSRTVMGRVLQASVRRCSGAITPSASVASDFQAALGRRIPVHTVWNAVDLREFSAEGPTLDLDALSGLQPPSRKTVRVGLVGTFAKWKGHDVFLRALAMLPANLAVRAYIVGGPVYQTDGSQWSLEELRQHAADLGLTGRVGFTGFVSRPAEAMRSLDVVVHASTKPEPFGLVIAEAMACRRAVVVSRSGGAAEIIRDDSNAVSHRPGNTEELATAILRLAQDSKLREALSHSAVQTARKHFDRARLGTEMAAIYRSVTSGRPARAA